MTTVFVDAENVRRSQWPNLSPEELVERTCSWAAAQGFRPIIVFDGPAPDHTSHHECKVVGTAQETADDWIAGAAAEEHDYWLVTSDRGLRERAARAERVIGGGAFLRALLD